MAGPIARSVEDVARLLEALAAVDPADPLTSLSKFLTRPLNYTAGLSRDALKVRAQKMGRAPYEQAVIQKAPSLAMQGRGFCLAIPSDDTLECGAAAPDIAAHN